MVGSSLYVSFFLEWSCGTYYQLVCAANFSTCKDRMFTLLSITAVSLHDWDCFLSPFFNIFTDIICLAAGLFSLILNDFNVINSLNSILAQCCNATAYVTAYIILYRVHYLIYYLGYWLNVFLSFLCIIG